MIHYFYKFLFIAVLLNTPAMVTSRQNPPSSANNGRLRRNNVSREYQAKPLSPRGGYSLPPPSRSELFMRRRQSPRGFSKLFGAHQTVQQASSKTKLFIDKWSSNWESLTSSRKPPIRYDSGRHGVIDGDLVLPAYCEVAPEEAKRQHQEPHNESQEQQQDEAKELTKSKTNKSLSTLDMALFGTYFCNSVAMTLPVVLMPMVAAERVAATAGLTSAATVVATLASISTLGGGVGKCLNGFVCQVLGGRRSSALYLLGMALTCFGLASSPARYAGFCLAAMEFFASIQWTACSLVMANHYERTPEKFAKGITILSLASTSGTLSAKMGGTALLRILPSWRDVAQCATLMALMGAIISNVFVSEHPASKRNFGIFPSLLRRSNNRNGGFESIRKSIQAVLGNPLFWQVGIAHATAMLARTSDKVLGAFFHQTTALPRSTCGGLTAFVTFGFVHGLYKGRSFHKLPDVSSKTKMLSKAYTSSTLAALGLALCANDFVQKIFFSSQVFLAAVVAVITSILASSISFQFYQIPAMVATTFFGSNKALCLSLLDGMGFFLSAPVWAMTGKIVGYGGKHGWTLSWVMLATMFALGGKAMMNVIPGILQKQEQSRQHR